MFFLFFSSIFVLTNIVNPDYAYFEKQGVLLKKYVEADRKTMPHLSSPFFEIALLKKSEKFQSENRKINFLRNHLFFCVKHLSNIRFKRFKKWILSDDYFLEIKLKLLGICDKQLDNSSLSKVYEFLWKSFPSHPRGAGFLKKALSSANNSEKSRILKYLIFSYPEYLGEKEFTDTIRDLNCKELEKTASILLRKGGYSKFPLLREKCGFNFKYGIYLYKTGKYKKAAEIFSKITSSSASKWLHRCNQHMRSPDKNVKKHLDDWKISHNDRDLIKALKTLMLAEQSKKMTSLASLIKIKTSYVLWLKGYIKFLNGRKTSAGLLWKQALTGNRSMAEERLKYWIAKVENKPVDKGILKNHPVHSFYWRLYLTMKNRVSVKTLKPLSLMDFNNSSDFSFSLSDFNVQKAPREFLIGLVLLKYGFKNEAAPYLYKVLALKSYRYRRFPQELQKCWSFNEGNPYACPRISHNTLNFGITADLRSKIAGIYGWYHLDPLKNKYLPKPYKSVILRASKRFDLPRAFLYAIMMTESRYDPYDISPANAIGLFQMIPSTGSEVAEYLKIHDFTPSDLLSPEVSIMFGAAYLAKLVKKFGKNWHLVIAAYNAGPHQVTRWLKRKSAVLQTDKWIEEIPFRETGNYVKLVLGRWILYAREIGENPPVLPASFKSLSW